jgi:hypothetical protein
LPVSFIDGGNQSTWIKPPTVLQKIYTTGATKVEQYLLILSEHLRSPSVFSGARVYQLLVFFLVSFTLFYILQGLRDQFEPKEAAAAEAWMKIADDQSNYLIFSRFVHTSKNILIKDINRECKTRLKYASCTASDPLLPVKYKTM